MRKGVWSCKQITLKYCAYGGSSKVARAYKESDLAKQFISKNEQLKVVFEQKNGHHPNLVADYGGSNRLLRDGTREAKQVGLKTVQSVEDLHAVVEGLRNQQGGKQKDMNGRRKWTETPSVQGVWTPTMVIE